VIVSVAVELAIPLAVSGYAGSGPLIGASCEDTDLLSSFPFVTCGFVLGVLTASRAVTYRRELPASYGQGSGDQEAVGVIEASRISVGRGQACAPRVDAALPRRVTTPVCSSSTGCDVNTCPHERCRGVPPKFIGLLGDAATIRGK
jgi:hypothetical protein